MTASSRPLRHKPLNLILGSVLTVTVAMVALVSPIWTPYDANSMNPGDRLQPPGVAHLMGTDQYGRDILSRVMVGASRSLFMGLAAVAMGMVLGVGLGMAAALWTGLADEAIMRLADVLFAFPAVLTAILLTAVIGPSLLVAMLAIGLFYVPVFARLTRATALEILELEFVQAARACGLNRLKLVCRHVLPNIASPLIIQATVQFAVAVLAEAGLSYLGLATQPPHPSWGRMLSEAGTLMALAPWMALFPGLAIAATVLGLNLLGDGLRDLLDPRAGM